jgi:hypothetical protein
MDQLVRWDLVSPFFPDSKYAPLQEQENALMGVPRFSPNSGFAEVMPDRIGATFPFMD